MNPQDPLKSKTDTAPHLSRSAQRALEAAKRKAAIQQKVLLILLGIALVINAIIGFVLYQRMVVKQQQLNLSNLTQEVAAERSKALSRYLQQQTAAIDQLAAEPELSAILDFTNPANTPEARDQLEQKWQQATADALKLRLIPMGSAELDREAEFPIRYAELDLIQRAEKREATLPELVQINNRWMFNWTRPLPATGTELPLGSLMVTTDATELLNILNTSEQALGEFILLQQFAGSPAQLVAKIGSGTAGSSMQNNVAGSYLAVKFTPSEYLLERAEELPALWLTVISVIVAGSLALVWFLSKILVRAELGGDKSTAAPLLADVTKTRKESVDASDAMTDPLFQKQDILDIAVIDEDENILGLQSASGKKSNTGSRTKINEDSIPAEIFRSYDIRGLVDSQITPEFAQLLGQAIGSEAIDQGEQNIVVARDARTHSESLTQALVRGILRTGCNVINIGVVPTPLMYFSTFHFDDTCSGVMVTASHNPKEYNGFKVVMNNRALADDAVTDLRARIIGQRFHQGLGEETPRTIIPDYIDRIFSDVALAGNVSVVIDAGNAVTGIVAPALFEELGCEVIPLFCDLDGEFPNHDPDPTIEKNLQHLIAKVQETNADIGVAFDGDGDRLVVVTPKGDIIWPDRLLMLFAKDILARNPGADVLFDVKCSRQLNQVISSYGGRPIMWKTGHSPMKAKMEETQALIGGEYSGHIFIKDRWYGFDDGIYAMARLLEIITLRDQKVDDIFAAFPQLLITPEIKIPVAEQDKFALIAKLSDSGDFANGTATTIDGLRIDYTKGWGLVRASNTSPALTLRFEAESAEALEKIQQIFKRELLKVDKTLAIPF
ncbi:phosphomannomutase/phosphoglucomutase [Cellvibrio sp. UBA7661]|uniref:phosphomannomutase/phosphoglucomutase n=1 Tax=Cellvibrio sp. UBA7661 TaxID=1946311 RepID=UPI002F35C7A9